MNLSDWQLLGCIVLLAMLARMLFGRLLANIATAGRGWYAALLVMVTSPGLLLLLGHYGENRPWSDFTDLGTMPWSVVFGDGIVLPLAVMVAAGSASHWYKEEFALSSWWRWTCGLVGLAAGIGFHAWDAGNYRKGGFGIYADALTKAWHDLAVYSILVAILLWVGVLVFRFANKAQKWTFGLLLFVQFVLMAIDANRGLKPSKMHGACDLACGSQNLAVHLHDVLYWLIGLL